jgi:hypothetical protein
VILRLWRRNHALGGAGTLLNVTDFIAIQYIFLTLYYVNSFNVKMARLADLTSLCMLAVNINGEHLVCDLLWKNQFFRHYVAYVSSD